MKNIFDIHLPKSTALHEVAIIRPIVIFLLVVLHSFSIFGDGWDRPSGVEPIGVYYWLTVFISGFRIETIALVAGYVYSYQTNELNRTYSFVPYIKKKFKRLLIPCFFFSTFYYFMFYYNPNTFNILKFILTLFNCGHLWFLPMLFWCFVVIWLIDKYIKKSYILLILLSFISIIPIPFKLLGINGVFHFIFYCYWGYVLFLDKDKILSKFANNKSIIVVWVMYALLTILFYTFIFPHLDYTSVVFSVMLKTRIIANTIKLIISILGVIGIYLTICRILDRKHVVELPKNVARLSTLCYGIYVFHQFVLKYIYYYSTIPQIVNSYLLPWIALIATLLISYLLTCLFLNSRFGRFLIG